MIKRALWLAAGLCGMVQLAAAQSWDDSTFVTNVSLGRTWGGFPSLALDRGDRFAFPGSFAAMDPVAPVLPAFRPVAPRRARYTPTAEIRDYDERYDLARQKYYVHGEVSFLYGRFTGHGGGDFYQTSILSVIGNDHFQLSVGAAFSEFNGRGAYGRR